MEASLNTVSFREVWTELGGPEIRRGRAPAFWRDSDDLNISIDIDRGIFYDHVTHRGGGVLGLIETVLNCDRASAVAWLEDHGYVGRRRFNEFERREHLRKKYDAHEAAKNIEAWRRALTEELNADKVAAAGDEVALCQMASLCNLLENGTPENIIREFIRAREQDPHRVARLIALGQELEADDARITAEVVFLLARSTEEEITGHAA